MEQQQQQQQSGIREFVGKDAACIVERHRTLGCG